MPATMSDASARSSDANNNGNINENGITDTNGNATKDGNNGSDERDRHLPETFFR